MKTGNYIIEPIINKIVIEMFQGSAFQLIYGQYIDDKYKILNKVHNFNDFINKYGKQVEIPYVFDVAYYRISDTECSTIIQYLDSELNLLCGVETICEGQGFDKINKIYEWNSK